MILLTECFSIYSDISTRMSAFSSSNINSAKALVSSVLPTPVGPRNINEAMGRFGSEMPARERLTASATFCTASFCPTTRAWSSCSMRLRRTASSSSMRDTGMPVHFATMLAMSLSVISSFSMRRVDCSFLSRLTFCSSSRSRLGISP